MKFDQKTFTVIAQVVTLTIVFAAAYFLTHDQFLAGVWAFILVERVMISKSMHGLPHPGTCSCTHCTK